MGQKLKYVMFPCFVKKEEKEIQTRNCNTFYNINIFYYLGDLWGPLLLSLLLGL